MPTGHSFMAMSLDGFVARTDHRLDWLIKQRTDGEDHGFFSFMASVDGLVMGSGSFRAAIGFDKWPYDKPVIVLSRTLTEADIPPHLSSKVRLSSKTPQELMADLKSNGWQRVYVDGGQIVHSFLRAGLIQDMVVTVIPILIGSGLTMFGDPRNDINLQFLSATPFPSGLVRLNYRIT